MISWIILTCLFGTIGFCVYLMIRNELTFRAVMKVNNKIFERYPNGSYKHTLNEVVDLLFKWENQYGYSKVLFSIFKRPSYFAGKFIKEEIDKE